MKKKKEIKEKLKACKCSLENTEHAIENLYDKYPLGPAALRDDEYDDAILLSLLREERDKLSPYIEALKWVLELNN